MSAFKVKTAKQQLKPNQIRHPKNDGFVISEISKSSRTGKKETVFQIDARRIKCGRINESSISQAKATARRLYHQLKAVGSNGIVSDPADLLFCKQLLDLLEKKGIDRQDILNYVKKRPSVKKTTLEVARLLLKKKETQSFRGKTYTDLQTFIGDLEASLIGGKFIGDVTKDDIKDWLLFIKRRDGSNKHLTLTTKKNKFIKYAQLENFAVAEKYLNVKVTDSFSNLDRADVYGRDSDREVEKAEIRPLSPEQAKRLLLGAWNFKGRRGATGIDDVFPALILELFCGIRQEEITRLTWDSINLEEGTVTCKIEESKGWKQRVNLIPDNALKMLKLRDWDRNNIRTNLVNKFKKQYSQDNYIVSESYVGKYGKKVTRVWKQVMKLDSSDEELSKNFRRHSYASYAIHHLGRDKTKINMGHTDRSITLEKHYQHSVNPKEAQKWFEVDISADVLSS